MSRPPFPEKPKTRAGIPLTTFLLLGFMVVLGVMIGASAMLAAAPTLLNVPATQRYFNTLEAHVTLREQSLAATAVELGVQAGGIVSRATAQAAEVQATRAALVNAQALLAQTATQSHNFALATATANAALVSRQLTQVALDFAATQTQLDINATQVALDFAATMAALSTPRAGLPLPEVSAVAALAVMETPSPTPTLERFSAGIPATRWLSSGSADWSQSQQGVVALAENAWLLSRVSSSSDLSVAWEPALDPAAVYRFALVGRGGENWYLQLDTDTLRVARVALYRFDGSLPITATGELLAEAAVDIPLTGSSLLAVTTEGAFAVSINGSPVLRVEGRTTPFPAALGVQMPRGAALLSVHLDQE